MIKLVHVQIRMREKKVKDGLKIVFKIFSM